MSRTKRRTGDIDLPARVQLLENDADTFDEMFTRIRAEMQDGFAKCEQDSKDLAKKVDGSNRLLITLLIAVIAGSLGIIAAMAGLG